MREAKVTILIPKTLTENVQNKNNKTKYTIKGVRIRPKNQQGNSKNEGST